jgi:hypothetical protein
MCMEINALHTLQMLEDKMVKLIPLSEEDKIFLIRNNMQERIEAHKTYLGAMQKAKDTEEHYRKVYGNDIIDKLIRGMPLS